MGYSRINGLSVPQGGCVKYTEGTYQQVFDEEGNLVNADFYADNATYEDENNTKLEPTDPRMDFYAPFDTPVARTTKEVAGYEFPANMEFSRETVWVLEHVSRFGAAYVQIDDSADDQKLLGELKTAALSDYFDVIEQDQHNLIVVDRSKFEVERGD